MTRTVFIPALIAVGAIMISSLNASEGPYGLTDNCSCTGSVPKYCSEEWTEISDNTAPGDPYIATPHLAAAGVTNCNSCGSFQLTAGSASVSAGSWSGSEDLAAGFQFPIGFSLGLDLSVEMNGQEQVTVTWEASAECLPNCTCCRHEGAAGAKYNSKTRTIEYRHYCWGAPVGSTCNDLQVSCGHHDLSLSATLVYVEALAAVELTCGRALTPDEKSECGPPCGE